MTRLIRSMTPMICLTICSLVAMNWMQKAWQSQLADLRETNRESIREHNLLTRTLLGVQSDSQSQTVTISTPPKNDVSNPLDVPFGDLPVDEDLMREYEEFRAGSGTLSGQPPRTNPLVPQIVPGQMPTE